MKLKRIEVKKTRAGDLIKFVEERNPYTIQARSSRYLVCTKPFAPRKTVIYTVVDLERQIRGTENLVFGHGQETREQCYETLLRLHGIYPGLDWATEVSHRNNVSLRIEYCREGKR